MNLKSFLSGGSFGTIALISSLSIFGAAAQAQESIQNPIKTYENPAEALETGYFQNSKNSFDSMSLFRQWIGITGASQFPRGSYPEISIERDNRLVNAVYRDVLMQQTMNDPYVRVPDLPSPYNTSLMTLPSLQTGRVIGTELVYDRRPTP